ncbi:MAG: sodium:proton antiporter, partial [Planctomycetia bacterium]
MTHDSHATTGGTTATSRLLAGLAMVLVLYAAAAAAGWPQHGRDLLVAAQAAHHAHAPHESDPGTSPPAATVLPFCLLLAAIAILPLTPRLAHWWEHNSSKLLVAGILGLATLAYYLFLHPHPVDLHFPTHAAVAPAAAGPSWGVAGAVLANAFLSEYVPFIVLLFALYVISGGVRIEGDLVATPRVNTTFLGVGALAASFIGTTGAAMLLVRPLLETNSERRHVAHT